MELYGQVLISAVVIAVVMGLIWWFNQDTPPKSPDDTPLGIKNFNPLFTSHGRIMTSPASDDRFQALPERYEYVHIQRTISEPAWINRVSNGDGMTYRFGLSHLDGLHGFSHTLSLPSGRYILKTALNPHHVKNSHLLDIVGRAYDSFNNTAVTFNRHAVTTQGEYFWVFDVSEDGTYTVTIVFDVENGHYQGEIDMLSFVVERVSDTFDNPAGNVI